MIERFAVFFYLLMVGSALGIAQEQPNILVFIADDAGMDFGCYGNKAIKTPAIDHLASEGLRFTQAFLTSSQCSPSRTSMLSGYYAHTIGTEDLHTGIPDSVKLVPHYLNMAGYYTGLMLKGHIGKAGTQQFDWYDQGFPGYFQQPEVWDSMAVSYFEDFLTAAGDQPFFLWVGFVDPHRGYGDHPIKQRHDPDQVEVPPFLINDEPTRNDLADYYDEIARMDDHIAGMLSVLEQRNKSEHTVVLFLSDNGMPFPGAKGTLYDAGIHTPLIIKYPGLTEPGTVFDGLVSTIDLFPTFMEVAGVDMESPRPGTSLLPILEHPEQEGRSWIFAERNWHGGEEYLRCIRNGRYKLILNGYPQLLLSVPGDLTASPSWYALKAHQEAGSLDKCQQRIFSFPRAMVAGYDLKEDPCESQNLLLHPEQRDMWLEMLSELKDWQERTNDRQPENPRKPDRSDRKTGFPLR